MLNFEKTSEIREQEQPPLKLSHWKVVLNNGLHVWQNDMGADRLSWFALKDYLEQHQLHIVQFWLEYRSNRKLIAENPIGVYWARGFVAGLGGGEFQCHSVGIWDGSSFTKRFYSNPDLEVRECYQDKLDLESPNLIWQKNELKITNL